jgi:hypothetical protein
MQEPSPQITPLPDAPPAENGSADQDGGARNRSTIAFPYGSLKDAEQIAQALHETWGDSASPEQLAGGLNASPRSGAFRVKTGAARTFGVVSVGRGQISLTPLGRQILDPQTRASARVDAFLAVPLFKALFDEYKNSQLPPDKGLEHKMAELGVSHKQTAKARQAFQRSAELAGFFKHGRSRLVEPATKAGTTSAPKDGTKEEPAATPPATSNSSMPAPLPELWLTLLRDGRSWSPEKTQEFVETARKLHELLAKTS